jgi:TPR repeat protein
MYLYGTGVEQSNLQAYKWFIIASYENELVRLIEKHLSKAEIENAKRIAKIWTQQNLESNDTP